MKARLSFNEQIWKQWSAIKIITVIPITFDVLN